MGDELLGADSVALIYDEVEGLNFYRDFGRLDALFADPTLARDRTNLGRLREYLRDESVSPLAIRRLVQRHPDGVDPVFRTLLRKPGFSWSRDGEKLLRREKESFFDREPTPSISIVGGRLAEFSAPPGWSAWSSVRVGPASGDELGVPAQQCTGREKPHPAQRGRQQPAERAEDRAVEPGQGGSKVGAAQHGDLVSQDQDLGVFSGVGAGEQRQPGQHAYEHQVGESEGHGARSCWGTAGR